MRLSHVPELVKHIRAAGSGLSRRKTRRLAGLWVAHPQFEEDVQKAAGSAGLTLSSKHVDTLRSWLKDTAVDTIHRYNPKGQQTTPLNYVLKHLSYCVKIYLENLKPVTRAIPEAPSKVTSVGDVEQKPAMPPLFDARSRALALMAQGKRIGEVAQILRDKYHPFMSLDEVKRKYFAKTGPCSLAKYERAPRFLILGKLRRVRAQFMKLRALHQDPEFAAARDERSRKTMRALHQDPEFAAARDERLHALNQDLEFRQKIREGLDRFWTQYRLAVQGLNMGLGWESQRQVPIVESAETAALTKLARDSLYDALLKLPVDQRSVVAEEFGMQLPPKSVEDQTHLTPRKWQKLLQKALGQLAKDQNLKDSTK